MKMKYIFVLFSLVLTSNVFGQADFKVYDWDELAECDPDSIYGISFRKRKMDSIPFELIKFKNVRYLDFERNKLKEVPLFVKQFSYLEYLNLGKNELINFPLALCKMENIKTVLLHMNEISYLPSCIGEMKGLESLDLFKNPIRKFPDELAKLQNLETLELRSIKFSPEFQEKWEEALPNTKIMFDPPCDCMK